MFSSSCVGGLWLQLCGWAVAPAVLAGCGLNVSNCIFIIEMIKTLYILHGSVIQNFLPGRQQVKLDSLQDIKWMMHNHLIMAMF